MRGAIVQSGWDGACFNLGVSGLLVSCTGEVYSQSERGTAITRAIRPSEKNESLGRIAVLDGGTGVLLHGL